MTNAQANCWIWTGLGRERQLATKEPNKAEFEEGGRVGGATPTTLDPPLSEGRRADPAEGGCDIPAEACDLR